MAEKKTNSAFMKPVQPDEILGKVVGAKPLPRTEIVKKFWEYVKKNNLQNAEDKRRIDADAILKPLFGKDQIHMTEVPGVIGKHVKK